MIHKLVICPITHEKLKLAPPEILNEMNGKIARRAAKNKKGEALTAKLEKALINQSQTYLYPIISDIPLLVPDCAVKLSGD